MRLPGGALVALGAVWFSYFASIGTFNPYAPLWFKDLGLSTLAIGAISALQAWTRVFAPYAWGWLADRSGHRIELMRVASGLSLLASVGLLFTEQHALVEALVFLLFMANGGVVPLVESALSQRLGTGSGMDAARYGQVRVWGSIGFIVAVTLFGVVLQAFHIRLFPWLLVVTLALMLAASCRVPLAREEHPHSHELSPSVLAVLRRPAVAWFFGGVFLTVLAHTSLYAFFSLYLDALGYGTAAVGLYWAVSVGVEIAFFAAQGRLSALMSPSAWLVAAALASALRFSATAAFGDQPAVLVAAQALHALTFAAQHAACIALVHHHFPGRLRGRGQALYSTLGYGLSGVCGGLLGGEISELFGFEAVFWFAALVSVAATLACWRAAVLHREAA